MLDIGRCDYLTLERPDTLSWLVTDFWSTLLRDLERVAYGLPGTVTIVALLFFDGTVPDGAQLPQHCRLDHAFRRERIMEIELRPWLQLEVEDWLTRWGGLSRHPAKDIHVLAHTIMAVSGGSPTVIANLLLEQCAALQSHLALA